MHGSLAHAWAGLLHLVMSCGSTTEGQGLVCWQGAWLTDEEVDKVMKQYDADGSGDISFEEFSRLVRAASAACQGSSHNQLMLQRQFSIVWPGGGLSSASRACMQARVTCSFCLHGPQHPGVAQS